MNDINELTIIHILDLINKNELNKLFDECLIPVEKFDNFLLPYYLEKKEILINNYEKYLEYDVKYDKNNDNVLIWACKNCYQDVALKILKHKNFDLEYIDNNDNDDNTALDYSIKNELYDVEIEILKIKYSNNKIFNNIYEKHHQYRNRRYLLYFLCEHNFELFALEILKIYKPEHYYLDYVNIINNETVLSMACKNNMTKVSSEILKISLKYNINININNNNVLFWAKKNNILNIQYAIYKKKLYNFLYKNKCTLIFFSIIFHKIFIYYC